MLLEASRRLWFSHIFSARIHRTMPAVCRCIHEQVGKLADICLWQPAFFGSKPEMAMALFCHMKSARLFASRDRMPAETRPGCHWPSWLRSSRAGRLHGRRWVIPTHLFLRFGTQIPCKRLQNGKVWDIAFDQPVQRPQPVLMRPMFGSFGKAVGQKLNSWVKLVCGPEVT